MKAFDTLKATDVQLLARYEQGRDQRAFSEVVRRHGPMVLATALRDLGNRHDAEEAFQATFMALAKGVDRIRSKEALPAWLHRTARRSASSIRRGNRRRSELLAQVTETTNKPDEQVSDSRDPALDIANADTARVLDEEISNLPTNLQVVLVLCHLEGRTQEQVAKHLSITPAAVRARLRKARERLGHKLVRRGVTASLAILTTYIVSSTESSAAVSTSLVATTTTHATLFAAGNSATEIGVSSNVIHAANKVISAMTTAKLATVGLVALAILSLSSAIPDVIVGSQQGQAVAGTLFIDDFSDGDFTDGSPVNWDNPPFVSGDIIAGENGLMLSPANQEGIGTVGIGANDFITKDVSIAATVRVVGDGDAAWIQGRNIGRDSVGGYVALVTYNQAFGGSVLALVRANGVGEGDFLRSVDGQFTVPLDFDVRLQDAAVQLDIFGDEIRAWAWQAGESKPTEPQFYQVDDAYLDPGFPSIGMTASPTNSPASNRGVTFRHVHVADRSIQGILDRLACSPINGLPGDLDGDGSVGFADFLALSTNFGSDVDDYSKGDVNCDGAVAFDDFLALSANFGRSLEDPSITQAAIVPEPSMAMLTSAMFASLAVISRRREH